MTQPEWRVRSGRPDDRALLASFTCADPAVAWQVEVEQFIRTQLIDWAFDPRAVSGDPRLLLALVTATVVSALEIGPATSSCPRLWPMSPLGYRRVTRAFSLSFMKTTSAASRSAYDTGSSRR
jgi:hypothetical protein